MQLLTVLNRLLLVLLLRFAVPVVAAVTLVPVTAAVSLAIFIVSLLSHSFWPALVQHYGGKASSVRAQFNVSL